MSSTNRPEWWSRKSPRARLRNSAHRQVAPHATTALRPFLALLIVKVQIRRHPGLETFWVIFGIRDFEGFPDHVRRDDLTLVRLPILTLRLEDPDHLILGVKDRRARTALVDQKVI